MPMILNEEQNMLKDSAKDFCTNSAPIERRGRGQAASITGCSTRTAAGIRYQGMRGKRWWMAWQSPTWKQNSRRVRGPVR